MSLVQLNNIYKQYNGEYIFENINLIINNDDKIGLIGLNGVGKSTLIKILLGYENFDGFNNNISQKGSLFINPNIKIGYLSQDNRFSSEENTVYEELLSVFVEHKEIGEKLHRLALKMSIEENIDEISKQYDELNIRYEALGGYDIEYKLKYVMQGLELNDYSEMILSNLSGGERTRVTLAKLLLQEPDLLILDEPTNHLDIISIEWLEEYLKQYNKAFLLVSHDRFFLDEVCNKIVEIENKELHQYNGNFSSFLIQKELILKGEIKRFEKESEKRKKLEEYISRYRAGIKAKQARGRQKILDRMKESKNPVFSPNRMKLKFEIKNPSADRVLEVKNLSKSFDDKTVFKNVSFNVFKGDKIGIIGKNGVGKSTLLKILLEKISLDSGEFKFGQRLNISYFDQRNSDLYPENNILQEINTSLGYTEEYLRTLAGAFLFTGDDVLKPISKLSGGEKVRVSLLKIIQQKPNLLILDEPTNHLDIYSIEVLEDALIDYEGTIILISHNRHFINSICNKIYYLSENGIEEFDGNYDNYRENISEKKEIKVKEKTDYHTRKEEQKKLNKRKKDIERIEKDINDIYLKLKILDEDMSKAGNINDIEKMIDIQKQIDEAKLLEEELLEKWTNLQED